MNGDLLAILVNQHYETGGCVQAQARQECLNLMITLLAD
jgi:hypothetical protein